MPTRMVLDRIMSVAEAKQSARNEIRNGSKNYLNEQVVDPVLQVGGPRRAILQKRINSNYFEPEERRRLYKEEEYDEYDDNYPNVAEMPMVVTPAVPGAAIPANAVPGVATPVNLVAAVPAATQGGRKSRKSRKGRKARKHKSRRH